jgi:hypothetical protein
MASLGAPPQTRPAAGRLASARDVLVGGAQVLGALLATPFLRRRFNRWGTRPGEPAAPMPGDDLVPHPDLGYTRARSIAAPPERVWPWLVQIGQGRGGLYSFDGLENLIGCRISSATAVLPEFQDLRPGDLIRLGPEGYPQFRVDSAAAPDHLVLVGAGPDGEADGDTVSTWQWQLRPLDGGRRTRLVVRQRLACPPSQRWLWRLVEPVAFVMERQMLRRLGRRAEG